MKISTHKHLINKVKITKEEKQIIMKQCVSNFIRHNVDNLDDLYSLVAKNCVYAPIYWENNYRKIANANINDIDLIIYDSDDGDTEEQILEMFDGVEILLLQTAGWTKELEKYRVFVPLETPISFDTPDEYTAFYRWLGDLIGLHYDSSTTECGRGYIGLKNKEGIISDGVRINPITSWEIEKQKFKKEQQILRLKREIADAKVKKYREKNGFKIPTVTEIRSSDKWSELIKKNHKDNYTKTYALLGYCKFRGLTANDAVDAISLENFGGEYNAGNESDRNTMIKRYERIK